MKKEQISGKYFNRIKISFILMLMALLCINFPSSATGSSLDDTREQMEAAEEEKKRREEELAAAEATLAQTEANLANLEGVRNSYQGQMEILNTSLQAVADRLAVLESKIALKELEIAQTQAELEAATLAREEQYESMKDRIQFLYERSSSVYSEILFSAQSFGEMLNYADYIEQLSEYDRMKLDEYFALEQQIAEQEAALQQEMQELQELREDMVAEQASVNELIRDTANNIAATADQIEDVAAAAAAYEEQCDAAEAAAAAAAAEYEQIKAQYEEELRLSQLAAQSARRDLSQVTFEENDRYLLANLIYCEAGAEPYEGKVAVGAVVINRVCSSVYPNTITGVIYQYKQFSPVRNGRLALALAENRATEACYRAADEAMAGVTNVGNRVYFRTPIPGLEGLQIGNHIFY